MFPFIRLSSFLNVMIFSFCSWGVGFRTNLFSTYLARMKASISCLGLYRQKCKQVLRIFITLYVDMMTVEAIYLIKWLVFLNNHVKQ